MQQHDVKEVDEFRGNLNYEQLLARAIDRCLYFRATDPYGAYYNAVIALGMSLVDMTGKRIKSDFDLYIKEQHYENYLGFLIVVSGETGKTLETYDNIFKEIAKILQKHKMLFRSQLIETNV